MSDFLASALGLGFTLVVCLLAVQALLSPWLRVRRFGEKKRSQRSAADVGTTHTSSHGTHVSATPETTPQIG